MTPTPTDKRPWKRWTENDDSYLRTHYPKGNLKELAFSLGRHVDAIRSRATSLGIRRTAAEWSAEELDILKRDYQRLGPVGVGKLIGRPSSTVKKAAARIGIKRKYPWTTRQDRLLRQRYPSEGASESLCGEIGKNVHQLHHRAASLGLSYSGPCKLRGRFVGRNSAAWRGVCDPSGDERFDIPGRAMKALRLGARSRRITCFLSPLEVWEVLRAQNGLCAKTGRPVSFMDGTASVDRIDSNGPYSRENIRITTVMANLCQLYYSDADMDQFCLDYVRHRGLLKAKDAEAEQAAAAASAQAAAQTTVRVNHEQHTEQISPAEARRMEAEAYHVEGAAA